MLSYSALRGFELTVTPRDKRLSLACPSAVYANGSGRFVVRADEKLTAFVELESAIRASSQFH